ncbi:hypothetical protein ACQUQP_08495 [Marinobacterium sp. YM272]|uniref:hypothetical protein n=1 Tax=Marinobacterium sp. YM272 TaxID=3421654 RepID=UPI003D7F44E3
MSLFLRRFIRTVLVITLPFTLSACVTNGLMMDNSAGANGYEIGFHDGRHSGLNGATDLSTSLIKDLTRYQADERYREGWLAGQEEGARIRAELASLRANKTAKATKPKSQAQGNKMPDMARPEDEVLERSSINTIDSSSIKF